MTSKERLEKLARGEELTQEEKVELLSECVLILTKDNQMDAILLKSLSILAEAHAKKIKTLETKVAQLEAKQNAIIGSN